MFGVIEQILVLQRCHLLFVFSGGYCAAGGVVVPKMSQTNV